MTVPAWLANVETEIAISRQPPRDEWLMTPEALQLSLLDWMSAHVNHWLDTTRVQGHPEARRLWARICRCYLSVAYFVALRGSTEAPRWRGIVDTCVRLNGLRLTPDPMVN